MKGSGHGGSGIGGEERGYGGGNTKQAAEHEGGNAHLASMFASDNTSESSGLASELLTPSFKVLYLIGFIAVCVFFYFVKHADTNAQPQQLSQSKFESPPPAQSPMFGSPTPAQSQMFETQSPTQSPAFGSPSSSRDSAVHLGTTDRSQSNQRSRVVTDR